MAYHIMKEYSYYGYNDFIICAGYKQHMIKEWFADYFLYNSDITFDFSKGNNDMIIHDRHVEPWKVTVVDTGLDTQTGGRIKRVQKYIGNKPFMLTYGDAVSDIDINKLLAFHNAHKKTVTLTSVIVAQSKGVLDIDDQSEDNTISSFREKAESDELRINGGYMVCEPEVFNYLKDDSTIFEREPLARLAEIGQLNSYMHDGFWHCMDTKREMDELEGYANSNSAPWMNWNK